MDDILDRISGMDAGELDRVQKAVDSRRRHLSRPGDEPMSVVVEYRPHADGYLQLEKRYHVNEKTGKRYERGPYWYFRYHEGGKQRTMYLGKTDDPEGTLAEKRRNVVDHEV